MHGQKICAISGCVRDGKTINTQSYYKAVSGNSVPTLGNVPNSELGCAYSSLFT